MDKNVIDISNVQLPNLSPRIIFIAIAVLLGVVVVLDSVYQVQPEEVGIIRRFGRYNAPPRPPDLHFKLPFIDTVVKVPVQRQLKQEFGFRTVTPQVRTVYSPQDLLGESLMLTGDLNVAVVAWIVQYRVSDPYEYLFKVRNVEDLSGHDRSGDASSCRGSDGHRGTDRGSSGDRKHRESKIAGTVQSVRNGHYH